MVPAHPRTLAKMLTPRRHRDPAYARAIAGEIYGGTMRTDPGRAARVRASAQTPVDVVGIYLFLPGGQT